MLEKLRDYRNKSTHLQEKDDAMKKWLEKRRLRKEIAKALDMADLATKKGTDFGMAGSQLKIVQGFFKVSEDYKAQAAELQKQLDEL